MHHQKKIYVTFQWCVFMVNMTNVSNSEVSVCSPCDAAARPVTLQLALQTALNTQFEFFMRRGQYGHLRHRKHHMVTMATESGHIFDHD